MNGQTTSNKNAGSLIRDRIPFSGSNFSAILVPMNPDSLYPIESFGMLPYTSLPDLLGSDYIVYSYATPIAWFKNGEWQLPNHKYSVTTSKHQSIVRKAIA